MSYRLSTNWENLVEDVRQKRLVSPTQSVSWNSGSKHGLEEGSVSRDIVSFVRWRLEHSATRDDILLGRPMAFQKENKVARDLCQEYLRELVKMGILESLNENV